MSWTYTVPSEQAAARPTYSVAAGTYATAQTVSISDATGGATIYYTTNGTTPTTSSTKYTGALTVSASETIEAIAVASGYGNSAAASAAYTISSTSSIKATTVVTPAFSVTTGAYTTAQSVTISDLTAGATIYYTTNGTSPTTSSAKYVSPISVSSAETIKAIAVKTGMVTSSEGQATYTIAAVLATPKFSVPAATYANAQSVTITDATAGATIYYTTNGTTPTAASTKYTDAIKVSATQTLKAVAVRTGYTPSVVAIAAYTIAPSAT